MTAPTDTKSEQDKAAPTGADYSATLFLPQTDFPMRAGLPKKEPEILARWAKLDIYRQQRAQAKGREKFVLHDGPPYANGNIHIGTALNKVLKDVVVRSHQMLGFDSGYVPGWDCHGLPIEWKIEEQYRAKGKNKDDVPINELRKECREFAAHWLNVQRDEFKRLGVEGDWDNPYTTMAYVAEAQIAREIMKFARADQLYRGSKPVMWSVVEKTSLAEAEIEYQDYQSDTIWVKFAISETSGPLAGANIVIWTTTPWTIPGNRAISFSSKIGYGLYKVTEAAADNWAKTGDLLVLADKLADNVMKQARVSGFERKLDVTTEMLQGIICTHPLRDLGYAFDVPLLDGDHVTDEAGTGFVHTAPGHGADDFEIWMANKAALEARGIDTEIPYTVDADGFFTKEAPGFEGKRVITGKGDKGDANDAVIAALTGAGMLIARGRLKHQYPHSWRSKKPIIFRNTPQWFIAMDKDYGDGTTLRSRALKAIGETRFVPPSGQNRLRGMVESKPDWVVSRQRAWGVPITVFVNKQTGALLKDADVDARIAEIFEAEGADAWFAEGAKERFLGNTYKGDEWEKVDDILDVWFDSGSTHAFVLEAREDMPWPASVYLEGSDQHRGWFQSSLLEACGTRGRAPYEAVVTHGFTMAEDGRKMSKSLGNQVFPQKIVDQYGADILRLWVMSTDFVEDQRIGAEILKSNADAYRRLRNTIRFMLGNLAGFEESERLPVEDMPDLERWVLHRLQELDLQVRQGYRDYAYQRLFSTLFNFATVDLSSVYFDIRKDALYCDAVTSVRRRACRTVLDHLFRCLVTWLAPMLCFTMEEAWSMRYGDGDDSVHLQLFPDVPETWRNDALAEKFRRLRQLRRVVTGAIEVERAEKRIGSSLEAAPTLYVSDADYLSAIQGVDLAELCITSALTVRPLEDAPGNAFRLAEATDKAAVAINEADGQKCARCWMILPEVGTISAHQDICRRCAATLDGAA